MADALGVLEEHDDAILARFLDDGFEDILPPPRPPAAVTPLDYRIFEAIGDPLPTSGLPLPFAHAELRHNIGWKARIEAAERLARTGALPPETLIALYREQAPAASGGVWDRVRAVRDLDAALVRKDADATAALLRDVVPLMASSGLLHAVAQVLGADLAALLPEDQQATRLAAWASAATPPGPTAVLGAAAGADGRLADAVRRGWTRPPSDAARRFLAEGRAGEAVLGAAATLAAGEAADPEDLADALATLRFLGLERHSYSIGLLIARAGLGMSDSNRIGAFLEAQAAEQGAAVNTRLAYGRDLVDFARWLGGRNVRLVEADRAAIEGYLVGCDAAGLSRATRARRLSAIRQLYRFAFEEGWRDRQPGDPDPRPGPRQAPADDAERGRGRRACSPRRGRSGAPTATGCATPAC